MTIQGELYGENFVKPPPELKEGEEVYDVETILNHRKRGRGYQYFVKWRDIQSPMPHGNQNMRFQMTVTH